MLPPATTSSLLLCWYVFLCSLTESSFLSWLGSLIARHYFFWILFSFTVLRSNNINKWTKCRPILTSYPDCHLPFWISHPDCLNSLSSCQGQIPSLGFHFDHSQVLFNFCCPFFCAIKSLVVSPLHTLCLPLIHVCIWCLRLFVFHVYIFRSWLPHGSISTPISCSLPDVSWTIRTIFPFHWIVVSF